MTARQKLIASTIDMIRRRGVSGTGISALLQDAGVSRRTIYLNFPSGKQELVAEATRYVAQVFSKSLHDIVRAPVLAEATADYADYWKEQLSVSNLRAGCPVVAAALGWAEAPEASEAAGRAFEDWRNILAERLREGGVNADNVEPLAVTIIAAIEGAVIMAIAMQSTGPLDDVGQQLGTLIEMNICR